MTRKLKLDVDRLLVESFEAQDTERRDGTVLGHDVAVSIDTCYDYTCRGYGTCGIYPCKPVP